MRLKVGLWRRIVPVIKKEPPFSDLRPTHRVRTFGSGLKTLHIGYQWIHRITVYNNQSLTIYADVVGFIKLNYTGILNNT